MAREIFAADRDQLKAIKDTFIEASKSSNKNGSAQVAASAIADRAARPPGFPSALDALDAKLSGENSNAPKVGSFRDFLDQVARVPLRGGAYGQFSFAGRKPLEHIVGIIDAVLRNVLKGEAVEICGRTFKPGTLKGATITVGGGAQFGKTILVLNLQGYLTSIVFVNVGYYVPDRDLLEKIVDTKFRPDVIDQQPWMAQMITVGKAENESGKAVNRKTSYQVSNGANKAFGHFCGMHKPPTTISLDAAVLDEVDDIPDKNMGYVSGRMTGSPLSLTMEIGTQRVHGAGQHKRVEMGTLDRYMVRCDACGQYWNIEENFPRIIRKGPGAEIITPEMGHDRDAYYYCACPECATPLDRDAGEYISLHPERAASAHFSIRVSQLAISAITLQEIVGAWYGAMQDPSGEAIVAFHCDRLGIPNAGAAQPITQAVLDRSRSRPDGATGKIGYSMTLSKGGTEEERLPRFAGLDTGPRCWLWVDEKADDLTSALAWAELMASGNVPSRLPLLMQLLGIECVLIDAGGEPDLTKRLCLTLNGMENYAPPVLPRNEMLKAQLGNLGFGLNWNGERAQWTGIRAAAVLFVAGEAKGIEQTIGFTQDGKIYPLIKCNRAESIQTAVNDFLTPDEGVIELLDTGVGKKVRTLPRARLPQTYIGPGASQAILDGHLVNLRKERDPRTGEEDWIDGVENHLGLAKTYARLAATVGGISKRGKFSYEPLSLPGRMGLARTKGVIG